MRHIRKAAVTTQYRIDGVENRYVHDRDRTARAAWAELLAEHASLARLHRGMVEAARVDCDAVPIALRIRTLRRIAPRPDLRRARGRVRRKLGTEILPIAMMVVVPAMASVTARRRREAGCWRSAISGKCLVTRRLRPKRRLNRQQCKKTDDPRPTLKARHVPPFA